jgi:hypothetical protein
LVTIACDDSLMAWIVVSWGILWRLV